MGGPHFRTSASEYSERDPVVATRTVRYLSQQRSGTVPVRYPLETPRPPTFRSFEALLRSFIFGIKAMNREKHTGRSRFHPGLGRFEVQYSRRQVCSVGVCPQSTLPVCTEYIRTSTGQGFQRQGFQQGERFQGRPPRHRPPYLVLVRVLSTYCYIE